MKRLIALTLVTLGITVSARAQWIVYDPTMNMQQIMAQAQNIAKYIQMIQNQVQQIQTLTDQLNEFKHYESLFGDPKAVLLSTVQPLIGDLKKTELGQTLTTLESTISTADAMLYNASGLFESIGTTFTTPNGQIITRQAIPFKPIAAVQKTTDNYLSVSTDAAARRVALKNQIAATTEQLKSAIFAGTLVVVPAFYLLVPDAASLGSDRCSAPAAQVWAAVAKPYIPSATALGLAFVIPFINSLFMFLGALVALIFKKVRPILAEKYIVPVSSGIICLK